jgi:hypothetical protein
MPDWDHQRRPNVCSSQGLPDLYRVGSTFGAGLSGGGSVARHGSQTIHAFITAPPASFSLPHFAQ